MPKIDTEDADHRVRSLRRLTLMLIGTVGLGAGGPSHAGLAEWIHGAPPPRPKARPPDRVAIVSRAAGVAPDAPVEDFLRAMAAAIKARDGKSMVPRLADRYAVDDLPGGLKASDFFVQAIEQLPGADEIVIRSIAVQSGARIAQTDFRFPKDVTKSHTFRFDADGRLLASDLFKLKRQGDGG
jgi:hypothetical protein